MHAKRIRETQPVAGGHTLCVSQPVKRKAGGSQAPLLVRKYKELKFIPNGPWRDLRAAAAKAIEADGGLDVLVNNAGIEGRTPGNAVIGPADETAGHMAALFDTNVFGMVRVLHAFLPLLQHSAAPVVVNLSSGLSKTADLADPDSPVHFYPGVAYPASKAAVNMVTVQYAKAFPGIKINAVDPGYTATDLNGGTGTQTVEQGAQIIVTMAQAGPDGPTGRHFDANGPVAW
jgi:NAD(P)-dependent dehydrogenase (short-subunit alcohol dehydrogenase family)